MAEIFPQLTHKKLGDCQAGELVRLSWASDQQHYVLIAQDDGAQYLLFLSTIGESRAPGLMALKRPDKSAISYGTAYRIEVDQGADYVDLTGTRLFEKSGTLRISDDHYVMRVNGVSGSQLYGSFYVRLDSGELVPEPAGNVPIFSKWSLMLPKGGERFETLCTIE